MRPASERTSTVDRSDWPAIARDVAAVRPIAQAFLAAMVMAEASSGARQPDLGARLSAWTVGEQVLRRGLGWAQDASGGGPEANERMEGMAK